MKIKVKKQMEKKDLTQAVESLISEVRDMKVILSELKLDVKKSSNSDLVELKRERLNIGKDKILHALSFHDVRGDVYLFKEYYLKNSFTPIRRVSPRKYEYFAEGKWRIDIDGLRLMQIVQYNIQQSYYMVNRLDAFSIEEFQMNQEHIQQLSTEKYKKRLLREISQELANEV